MDGKKRDSMDPWMEGGGIPLKPKWREGRSDAMESWTEKEVILWDLMEGARLYSFGP